MNLTSDRYGLVGEACLALNRASYCAQWWIQAQPTLRHPPFRSLLLGPHISLTNGFVFHFTLFLPLPPVSPHQPVHCQRRKGSKLSTGASVPASSGSGVWLPDALAVFPQSERNLGKVGGGNGHQINIMRQMQSFCHDE